MSGEEAKLALLINKQRASYDRELLNPSPTLQSVARKHAAGMERRNYFSHISADGSDFWQRIERGGYKPCFAAENIAQGQASAQQTLDDWTKSKGHLNNNITPKATEFGIGYVGDTWVMLFARPCP